MAFSFGFSGDDIEESQEKESHNAPEPTRSAFPVPGKPQLVPQLHNIKDLLQRLPSKIAYDTVDVPLDDGTRIQVTRRELWDVRVQLMAEEDIGEEGEAAGDFLGAHDVKTGIYEGGFKSWESSVDLVKVLAANSHPATLQDQSVRIIEVSYDHGFISHLRPNCVLLFKAGLWHCPSLSSSISMVNGPGIFAPSTIFLHSGRLQPFSVAPRDTAQLPSSLGVKE